MHRNATLAPLGSPRWRSGLVDFCDLRGQPAREVGTRSCGRTDRCEERLPGARSAAGSKREGRGRVGKDDGPGSVVTGCDATRLERPEGPHHSKGRCRAGGRGREHPREGGARSLCTSPRRACDRGEELPGPGGPSGRLVEGELERAVLVWFRGRLTRSRELLRLEQRHAKGLPGWVAEAAAQAPRTGNRSASRQGRWASWTATMCGCR